MALGGDTLVAPHSIEVCVFRFTLLWFKDMTLLAPYVFMLSGHAYVAYGGEVLFAP